MRKLIVAALAVLCFMLVATAPAMAKSIDAAWEDVRAPRVPMLYWAKADPDSTALLILDIEELTCNARVRAWSTSFPRWVRSPGRSTSPRYRSSWRPIVSLTG